MTLGVLELNDIPKSVAGILAVREKQNERKSVTNPYFIFCQVYKRIEIKRRKSFEFSDYKSKTKDRFSNGAASLI